MLDENELDVRRWEFAGPVERAYELSGRPVAMIQGPVGGGKTTGSARRCLRVAIWQHPSPRDGVRRARILCVCPTYRRAWDTVIPSFLKVFPGSLKCRDGSGGFKGSKGDPADHIFEVVLTIGGRPSVVRVEVLFRAVNELEVEEFLRGFEFTALWLPEADTNKDIDALLSLGATRTGRYPEPDDRPEDATDAYKGIFGDANAPIIDMPFHRRFHLKSLPDGKPAPRGDVLLIQPGGRSANAENLKNLRKISKDFYGEMAEKMTAYDVLRMIDNKPGYGRHGGPVHEDFDAERHVATRTIEQDIHAELYVGLDSGSGSLIPGAAFTQRRPSGQWCYGAEVHLDEGTMSTQELAQSLLQIKQARYPDVPDDQVYICGDPALNARNPQTEFTEAQAIAHYTGWEVRLAPTNKPDHRRNALRKLLQANLRGSPREPRVLFDPACKGLIAGLSGGFHYPRRGGVLATAPAKNRYSHVCEAAEYAPLTVDGIDETEGRLHPTGLAGGQYDAKVILGD